jgi:hypothetical protein
LKYIWSGFILELDFFTLFKDEHPNVQMQLRAFESLKPWFVKKLREWNICCKYHTEIDELKEGFNGIRSHGKGFHGQCTCSCVEICHPFGKDSGARKCQAHVYYFKILTKLWSSNLCPTNIFSSFHKRDCLLCSFPICVVKTLKICPFEVTLESLLIWFKISYVVGKSAYGHVKKVFTIEYCETQPS